jgi:hypothetical protein
MTEPKDPPRLFDAASGAPSGLRDLLSAAQSDVGSDQQIARLAERLGPLLAPPVVPAPDVAASAGMGALAKLGLAGVALLVAGGGALLFSTSKSAPPSAPIVVAAPPAPPAVAPSVSPAPEASETPPAVAVAPELSSAAKPATKPVPLAPLSEAELLEQARIALRSDPSRALARANEHRSRFPGGALVQEREVIAIKALRQLGRTAEADSRADAFGKAFPGSAFQRKLKPSP